MCRELIPNFVPSDEQVGCGRCDVTRVGAGVLLVCDTDPADVLFYEEVDGGFSRRVTDVHIN